MLKEARARPPMRLLLLRVYGFGRRSRRLLDLLGTRWRLLGSIDLIAAPDLASRTVEPSTFLEFVRGRLARLFIRSPDDLRARIAGIDDRPDPDARFRINQLFCSDDMWKAAVTHLMGEASLVAMDLRGFGPHRQRLRLRARDLLDTVPLDRLVFMIDWTHRPQRARSDPVRALAAARGGLAEPRRRAADAAAARRRRRATSRRCASCWRSPSSARWSPAPVRAAGAQAGTICIVARAFRHP